MPWLQFIVNANKEQLAQIENQLLSLGAASVTLQENIPAGEQEQPILEPGLNETPLWANTKIIGLFDARCNTEAITQAVRDCLQQTTVDMRWEPLEDQDWERAWMNHYQPIQVAPKLWICPSWETPPDAQATNVLLDPGLAFGTGTHPTTFLCMQWLSEQALAGKTVLDYGCGSGILGISALLLGAEQVTAVDIDPQALSATQANLKRNGLAAQKLRALLPQQTRQKAHILVANILAGPLVELADTLINSLYPGGQLCLSGILADQANVLITAYQDRASFDCPRQKEEWVCLTGRIL